MSRPSPIKDKSFNFSLRIIWFTQDLKKLNHFEISSQLLRSGTSVGANIAEAQSAESKADFIHKLSISLKEAKETQYWLELLLHSNISTSDTINSLLKDLSELIALLTAIIKSSRVK